MSILRHIKRMQYIDFVIRRKATGNLTTFAKKNNLSKRGLATVLSEMKEMGFPIKFNREFNSYYYEENGEMVKCLFIKQGEILPRSEMREVSGTNASNLCFSKIEIFEICTKV